MFIPENFDDIDDNTRLEIIKNSKDYRLVYFFIVLLAFFIVIAVSKYQNKSIWKTPKKYIRNSYYYNKFTHNHQL